MSISNLNKLTSSVTYGHYHICNLIENKISCDPQSDDLKLPFYQNGLKVPRNISNRNIAIDQTNNLMMIASGDAHICGIFEKPYPNSIHTYFKLYCWGDNTYGQLEFDYGYNEKLKKLPRHKINELIILARSNTTCITFSNIDLTARYESYYGTYCWGSIKYNNVIITEMVAIGMNDSVCVQYHNKIQCISDNYLLQEIPDDLNKSNYSLSIGYDHGCTSVTFHGHFNLGCWGSDTYGQINVPDDFIYFSSDYGAFNYFSCGVKLNGYMLCWGYVDTFHPIYAIHVPFQYTSIISTGGIHTCLLKDGLVNCIGSNNYGQLDTPQKLISSVVKIDSGFEFNCIINSYNKVYCWGLNGLGQTDVPVYFELTDVSVASLSSSLNRTCVQFSYSNSENNLMCWGGQNEFNQNNIPEGLDGKSIMVSAGDYHTCTIINDIYQKPSCFGTNFNGLMDVPSILSESSNEYMTEFISAGDQHNCVIYSTNLQRLTELNNILCWGSDEYGQSTVPYLIDQDRVFKSLDVGFHHSCAIYTEQGYNLVCWGLGYDNGIVREFRNPMIVRVGDRYDCVINKDHEAHCWGDNEYGQCDVPLITYDI